MSTLLDATTLPLSLSVLTVTKGTASKRLRADVQGFPVKDHGSLAITRGILEHVQVDGLAGLRTLLLDIRHDQALVHGIVKGSTLGHVAPVVTTDELRQAAPGAFAPDTIARSLDYLQYPDDGFLLMFDRDAHPDDPTQVDTADALIALLAPLLPGLGDAARLMTTSTSSGIKATATGEWLVPPKGSHTYVLARGDVARFRALLKARLWNAGYGYCVLASPNAQTGVAAVLERMAVDWTVFSPERLDYVAGARIAPDAPFYQDRGEPRLTAGTVFDLDALPDLTPVEQQDYADRLTAAKAALAPQRFALVKAVAEAADPTLTPAQVTAFVQQQLERHEGGLLPPEYLLYFDHRRQTVPVKDLSAAYDGLRLADPHEPTYRNGTDALFHWNNGAWLINSFAHGALRTYRAAPAPVGLSSPRRPVPDFTQPLTYKQRLDARLGALHGDSPSHTLTYAQRLQARLRSAV